MSFFMLMMMRKASGIVIRHGATAAGGYLLANGYADADTVQQISGGAVAALGVALSMIEKKVKF